MVAYKHGQMKVILMARYIDADKVVDIMRGAYWDEDIQSAKGDPCVIDAMIDWSIRQVKDAPTEDVTPVIHSHWVRMYNNDWLCSNCDNVLDESTDLNDIRYCSWCGAKMDEAEIIGKRLIDGFIDGIGDNAKSVGQKFINNDKDTVEHTIMGMKNEGVL